MKKILSSFALIMLCVTACKKPYLINDLDNFQRGSYLALVTLDKAILDYVNIDNEEVKFTANQVGTELDSIVVYAVKGGPDLNRTHWVRIKSTSTPSTNVSVTVTARELATAFGVQITDLTPGSQYTLYNENVAKDGRRFSTLNTEDDLEGQPAYKAFFTWTVNVVCPYVSSSTDNVIFEVVRDDWGDFAPGDAITIVNGPAANQITLQGVFPTSIDHKDIVVAIDPNTGAATVPVINYGKYSASDPGWSAQGTGFVFSCTGVVDLSLRHTRLSDNASASNVRLILRKP